MLHFFREVRGRGAAWRHLEEFGQVFRWADPTPYCSPVSIYPKTLPGRYSCGDSQNVDLPILPMLLKLCFSLFSINRGNEKIRIYCSFAYYPQTWKNIYRNINVIENIWKVQKSCTYESVKVSAGNMPQPYISILLGTFSFSPLGVLRCLFSFFLCSSFPILFFLIE